MAASGDRPSLDLIAAILTLDAGEVLAGALDSVPGGTEVLVADGGSAGSAALA
jgi:hypothetical protein